MEAVENTLHIKKSWNNLPCDDVRGSVDDLIAGFGGFESAVFRFDCILDGLKCSRKVKKFKLLDIGCKLSADFYMWHICKTFQTWLSVFFNGTPRALSRQVHLDCIYMGPIPWGVNLGRGFKS